MASGPMKKMRLTIRNVRIQYSVSANGSFNANLKTIIDADLPVGGSCLGIVGYTLNDSGVFADAVMYVDSVWSFQIRNITNATISKEASIFYLTLQE